MKKNFTLIFCLFSSLIYGKEISSEAEQIAAWWKGERFQGIERPYTPEKVESLRESLHQEYPSSQMAKKAYLLFKEARKTGGYSHTFGALDPVQVVEMANYLTSVYVSGWQSSSTASTTNEPGPDFADYPMDTVPNKVQQLFEAQRFHDRRQNEAMSRSENPPKPVDYLRPIIADADTGHGGLTAVMKLTKLFIQKGAAGIHLEDQKPGTKKCGHMSGKVLVSTQEHCDRLIASRLQADIMGSDLLIVARTDAEAANLLDTNIDYRDHAFILGTTNPHLPPLAEITMVATDKRERKSILGLETFPELWLIIHKIWEYQDGIQMKVIRDESTWELEALEKKAIQELSSVWMQKAHLITYYDAIVEEIKHSSSPNKEELLAIWRKEHDPFSGESNTHEPLNALSHKESIQLAKELGFEIFWDCEAPRTFEGYYQIQGGVNMSIARGRAFAPYADMLWMETAAPYLDDAEHFAKGIQKQFPEKFLAYNLSPSFNWDKFGLKDEEIASFQDELGKLGYVWQFITLAGFHGDALFASTFSKDFAERKMLAYVETIQRRERELKVKALTHQTWSGVELIGSQQDAATENRSSTGAHGLKSTENQFKR